MAKNSQTRWVPRRTVILYTIAAVLSLAGLADATYLTVAHMTGQNAVCGGSAECSKVLASSYAQLGKVPLAAFGVAGYFSAFAFAIFSVFGYSRARSLLSVTVWCIFAVTLWLLYAQAFLLHAFCRYCLLSAAVAFLLAGVLVAAPIQRR